MENIAYRDDLHRIVILNPKGGSGKTTVATNLASYFARRGPPPTLIDCDPLGYSYRWHKRRPPEAPRVFGAPAHEYVSRARTEDLTAWPGSAEMIVDLPAALDPEQLYDLTCDAHSILIPVMPSEIDIYAAALLIADLLLVAQVHLRDHRLGVIANRVRKNTRGYRMLMRFLTSLEIPLISELRDCQAYVHAAAEGIGICEMPPYKSRRDVEDLERIIAWLDQWRFRKPELALPAGFERVRETPVLTPLRSRNHH